MGMLCSTPRCRGESAVASYNGRRPCSERKATLKKLAVSRGAEADIGKTPLLGAKDGTGEMHSRGAEADIELPCRGAEDGIRKTPCPKCNRRATLEHMLAKSRMRHGGMPCRSAQGHWALTTALVCEQCQS